jgi:hypothetical protein
MSSGFLPGVDRDAEHVGLGVARHHQGVQHQW